MRIILVILVILLLGLGFAGPAGAAYVENFGFETGDFFPWITNAVWNTEVVTGATAYDGTIYLPKYGQYFAIAEAGSAWDHIQITQTFWLNSGQGLLGWAAFECLEDRGPPPWDMDYHDVAHVIVKTGASSHYRWGRSGNALGHTPWEQWNFIANESGWHTLVYEVYNGYDSQYVSRAFFDAWQLVDPPPPDVPLPGAVWLLGSGLVGLIGLRRKFNR